MRYAVPRILHDAGLLTCLYTDLLANRGWLRALQLVPRQCQPRLLRRLMSRGSDTAAIPREHVCSFPLLGLKYAVRRLWARTADELTRAHFEIGDTLSRCVLRIGLRDSTHIYAFETASLEVMRAVAGSGRTLVMEQTNAPREVLSELVERERRKHPEWEEPERAGTMDDAIMARYREAWSLSDLIVCGSQFVAEGIRRCSGPVSKCSIVPYGVDFNERHLRDEMWRRCLTDERYARRQGGQSLRVLTVGTVDLRKGAPYVLEAAQSLGSRARFRVAGAVEVTKQAAVRLAQRVELLGLVPRNEVQELYRWADVFLLPSVCEGSATVTYEALAHGLPVICTPNTGSVVRDGVDGLLVEPSSGEAVIAALEKVIAYPDLWQSMASAAFATSDQMDVKHYGERLLKAVGCTPEPT